MSMNGKRDDFTVDDFRACAKNALLKRGRADAILSDVVDAVSRWPEFAKAAKVDRAWRDTIAASLRLKFPAG
jgi:serine/threonine-protein kinase HipA